VKRDGGLLDDGREPEPLLVPKYSPFGIEFLGFLRFLHVEPEQFHPQNIGDELFEELKSGPLSPHISRSQVIATLQGRPGRLRHDMAIRWAFRSGVFLRREIERHRSYGTLSTFEKVMTKFSFVKMRDGHWIVDPNRLVEMYERSQRGERLRSASVEQLPRMVRLELVLEQPIETLSPEELEIQIRKLVEAQKYTLIGAGEGCTRIVIEVTSEQASRIRAAFASGDVQFTGLIEVREVEAASTPAIIKRFAGKGESIDPTTPDTTKHFRVSWRKIMAREEFVRPWRRLRFLFSTDVRSCPLAHVISESNDRAYAVRGILGRLRSLVIDLRMTVMLWPLVISATLCVLFLCQRNTYSLTAISLGVLSGVTLAVFGSQPCSILVSPLACGGGTVVMGVAFGLTQTVIMERLEIGTLFSQNGIRNDFFLSVTGGLVGLSAPSWRASIPIPLVVLLVAAIALSIAIAGWLMGQPQRAMATGGRLSRRKEVSGALLGAAAGGGIGLVYLFSRIFALMTDQPTAFILAFALIGGLFMGASTFLRVGGIQRPIVAGASHVLVATALFEIAFWTAGHPAGLFALAAASGYFHSTWFTTAFILGQWQGGPRAAFAATTGEGAIGFAAFVVARILQG
jgi:hypothetical protein